MAFGDIPTRGRFSKDKFEVPGTLNNFKKGWRKLSKVSQAWFGFQAGQDGGDDLPPDGRVPIDPFEWCCVPLMVVLPGFGLGIPGMGGLGAVKKNTLKKWICIPCYPTQGLNSHPSLAACKANCKIPPEIEPPVPLDPVPVPPNPTGSTPIQIEVTFVSCCVHAYRWAGVVYHNYYHTLPGLNEFGEITNETTAILNEIKTAYNGGGFNSPLSQGNGGVVDDNLFNQDFYSQLLPSSKNLEFQADAQERIRKTNVLKAVTTNGVGGNHAIGGWDGELNPDCVHPKDIERSFSIECRPMVYLPNESAEFGMPFWYTSLKYSFVNEWCHTYIPLVPSEHPMFEGPMGTSNGAGRANDGEYWKNCGGTACQCNSVESFRVRVNGDPTNNDYNGYAFGAGVGGGGPNGAAGGPQMILNVEAPERTHCNPCCQEQVPRQGGDFDVFGFTTGAWKQAAFLADFLLQTGLSTNPGGDIVVGAGESGGQACCKDIVRNSWRELVKPIMDGRGGQQIPQDTMFNACISNELTARRSGQENFAVRPDVAKVTGSEMMTLADGTSIPHQGICLFSNEAPPCAVGRIGDSYDHLSYGN